MPLSNEIIDIIYRYCNNHLANEEWYNTEFEFIEDPILCKRLIEEFKGIRFAYKLYECIEAKDESKRQIFLREYSGLRVPPIRSGIPTKRRMIPTSFLHAIRRNVLSVRK